MEAFLVSNKQQLEDAYAVRKIVFVDEQHVPIEEEIDQYETEANHFILYDQTIPIGAGRLRTFPNYGKVERICVLKEYRHCGAGSIIMDVIEQYASDHHIKKLILNAQTHAISFYEKLGYTVISDEFLDAGIPHRTMEKFLIK